MSFLKRFLSAIEGPTWTILIASLIVTLILGLTAKGTWESYLEGQRTENLQTEIAVDEEDEETRIGEEKIVPFWLVSCQGIGAAIAGFGFLWALATGWKAWGKVIVLILLSSAILVAWLPTDLFYNLDSIDQSRVGEVPAPWTYFVKTLLVALMIASPPVLLWSYYGMPILDQYVTRGLVTPLSLCFSGILSIWIIMDLTDNGQTFISSGASFDLLVRYYLVQIPQMVLMVLPITLLLALLYTLGAMSRSNEIISMLGAGQSMGRVLKPLLITGLYCTFLCTVLKFDWAPQAEAHKEGILNELNDLAAEKERETKRKSRNTEEWAALGWSYIHQDQNGLRRTWDVSRVPLHLAESPMQQVSVWLRLPDGTPVTTFKANQMYWDSETKEWVMRRSTIIEHDEFGQTKKSFFSTFRVKDWDETPWHVVSSSFKAEFLGIPGLTTYLRTNFTLPPEKLSSYRTQWHLCWAEPFRCFFIVLMAAPLGIVHSRRGVLGGVAAAIMIYFSLIFLDGMFLKFGESGRIAPVVGAWAPNIILGLVGCVLFWAKSKNRELPKIQDLFRRQRA